MPSHFAVTVVIQNRTFFGKVPQKYYEKIRLAKYHNNKRETICIGVVFCRYLMYQKSREQIEQFIFRHNLFSFHIMYNQKNKNPIKLYYTTK